MNLLLLKRDYKVQAAALEGEFPDSSNADLTLHDNVIVITTERELAAVLLCDVIPPYLHQVAFELWKNVKRVPEGRPMAFGGGKSQHRELRRDGVLSQRKGINARQRALLKKMGAREGHLGHLGDACGGDRCRQTPETLKHPEMLEGNWRLIKLVNSLYREHARDIHKRQRAEVKKAPRCRLGHTAFSSIYVLRNFYTTCHYDTNNLPGAFTALICCGEFTGGALILPRWRIAFTFKPGDLLLFDPQQLTAFCPLKASD